MKATSLRTFRQFLAGRKSELFTQLARVEQEVRTSPRADPADFGDQSAHTFNRELLFAQADANRSMLRMVQAALLRIEQGTFGECERCGEEIGLARLKAIPWARCCVACQEKLERRDRYAAA